LTALTGRLSLIALLVPFVLVCLIGVRGVKSVQVSVANQPGLPLLRVLSSTLTVAVLVWGILSPLICYLVLPLNALVTWAFVARDLERSGRVQRFSDLGHWILMVWFCGLLVATPLYHPYVRLTLPWLLSAYVGIGLAMQLSWNSLFHVELTGATDPKLARWLWIRVALLVLLVAVVGVRPIWSAGLRWGSAPLPDGREYVLMTSEIALVAADAKSAEGAPLPSVVYVYAEPALLFQLQLNGLAGVGPVGSLDFMRSQFSKDDAKVYLAVGVHAQADPRFVEAAENVRGRLKLVGSWRYHLGPLVALDQPGCDPHLLGIDPQDNARIELFEVLAP
jgi:hypothetical protein